MMHFYQELIPAMSISFDVCNSKGRPNILVGWNLGEWNAKKTKLKRLFFFATNLNIFN